MTQNLEDPVDFKEIAKMLYPESQSEQNMFIIRCYRTASGGKGLFDSILIDKLSILAN